MREIKSRVWDIEEERYLDETQLAGITPDGKRILFIEDYAEVCPLDIEGNFIVEPSTGLKDKNGREIYVGDIVRVEYRSRVYQVVYRQWDCSFMFKNDEDKEVINMFNGSPDNYEVIGNIHENPELLEGEDA